MPEPDNLRYTKTHEWILAEGDTATVGITQHAEEELGDVALVQLPEVGLIVKEGQKFGEIESIKAVSELFSPVSGEVVAVNDQLNSAPEDVNADPYGKGWMIKVRMSDSGEVASLLDANEYEAFLEES
jgi:glycine cleavage system H protein